MSVLDQTIREIVITELDARIGTSAGFPDLISVDAAAQMFGVDRSIVLALHHDRERNGFPSIQLSARTIRIDQLRLTQWCNAGGLRDIDTASPV